MTLIKALANIIVAVALACQLSGCAMHAYAETDGQPSAQAAGNDAGTQGGRADGSEDGAKQSANAQEDSEKRSASVHEEGNQQSANEQEEAPYEKSAAKEAHSKEDSPANAPGATDENQSANAQRKDASEQDQKFDPPVAAIASFNDEDRNVALDLQEPQDETAVAPIAKRNALTKAAWTEPSLTYRGHFTNVGWEGWQSSGDLRGGPGKTKLLSLQAFELKLNLGGESGGVTYRSHVQNIGWMGWVNGGTACGTTGQGLDIEAFEIKLTGSIANHYDIRYASDSRPRSNPKTATVVVGVSGQTCGNTGISWSLYNFGARLIKKSWNQVVRVRYEKADGSWTGYSNVVNSSFAYRDTVSWSRAADATYQAASISYLADGAATKSVDVYRKRATNTIQVRYQKADGSWASYSNASSGSDRVGAVRSWSRAADATYNAGSASITGTQSAQTKQVSISRKSYTTSFDSRGGTAVAAKTRLAGSKFSAPTPPTRTGYTFDGWYTAATGGTLVTASTDTPSSNVTYFAHWTPISYTVAFNANGAAGSMANQSLTYDKKATLTSNAFTSTARFTGWNTKANGTGTRYSDKQQVLNLTSTQGATITLYAQWEPFVHLPLSGLLEGPIFMVSSGASLAASFALTLLLRRRLAKRYRLRE